MIIKIDVTNQKIAEEVLSVQLASYKVEAELIDCYDIPPLRDTVSTLQRCGETFYGYYVDGELGGVISVKIEGDIIDIHRLMVHPKHFRKGIAKRLLDFIESHGEGDETLIVSTGSKNTPAISFYKKSGFVKMGEVKVKEGLSITSFEKKRKRNYR
ncbi:GNAT family N-acetyltransferase [Sporosarcina sp. NPDC096371]|uniref:GNAT family N-acetyltransferase n=1 Tax=Sporosarcina sp. NPDC096371 TaxID=3364530 RepID=UPI0038278D4B